MKNQILYLDLDGVILDSEERILKLKEEKDKENEKEISWDYFFEQVDWRKLLKESKEINDSIKIIKELEKFKQLAILTKCHTIEEMQAKVNELRNNRGLDIPIFICPPHVKKSQIVIPDNNILVDDSKKNINDWNLNGGEGILFKSDYNDNDYKQVRSLEFLLKR